MFVGCHLQPKVKVGVLDLARQADVDAFHGDLYLTSVYLTSGEDVTLRLHGAAPGTLAVARLQAETCPTASLSLQIPVGRGADADLRLEAEGGELDLVGFFAEAMPAPARVRATAPRRLSAKKLDVAASMPAQTVAAAASPSKPVVAVPAVTTGASLSKPSGAASVSPATAVQAHVEFAPSKTFTGARAGMVFKKGDKGLGYYKDTYVAVKEFVPSKSFTGARSGMVFQKGPKGLGYYKDTYEASRLNGKRKAEGYLADTPEPKKRTNADTPPDKQQKMVMALPGGLKCEIIRAGPPNAPKAMKGRKVQVRYDGRLASNGRRFDKGKISFRLGASEVIKGWDMGVEGMRKGEQRRLLIPSNLGYGASGAPPDIPRNAALVFDVELLAV
jgi:FK506-binding nuclear protein